MSEQSVLQLESEAGFKALFEFATIGILVIGSNGCIELANPCIEKLFDYKKAELIGQPVEILIPEAFRRNHVHYREGYFEKPKARPMGYGLNLFARKKDGTEFAAEISLGHYQLEDQQLAVAFVTDITERKRSREELEDKVIERTLEVTQSLEREKELNEMKSRFVAMASHEFRTPLTAILSSLALVDTYKNECHEEKRKKHIERIKSSVTNLTEILNDFLLLDKAEQGKVEIFMERFDLAEFAEDIIEETNGILKQGQRISFLYNGEKEIVQDKKMLRHVFLNLLSNAIKYSGEDKIVYFSIEASQGLVNVKVKDEGIGIPDDEQQHLFDKYYRAKNATNIQGTGLGLSIVKRHVELLNGTISFISKFGEGTTFTIGFPQKFITR
jgi:PAS domain S-box-containing protein